jgi:hypothetical protein
MAWIYPVRRAALPVTVLTFRVFLEDLPRARQLRLAWFAAVSRAETSARKNAPMLGAQYKRPQLRPFASESNFVA